MTSGLPNEVPDVTDDPGGAVGDVGHDPGGKRHDGIHRPAEGAGHVAVGSESPDEEQNDHYDDDDFDFCIHG